MKLAVDLLYDVTEKMTRDNAALVNPSFVYARVIMSFAEKLPFPFGKITENEPCTA